MDYINIIKEMIKPELLILIPVLYFIGIAIRNSEKVNNAYIPLIVGLLGICIALLYVLATEPAGTSQEIMLAIFTAITQGVLVAGASVYINQIIKQYGYTKETNKKDNAEV